MDFADPDLQKWAVSLARRICVRFPSWQFASGEIEQEALLALWGCIDRFEGETKEELQRYAAGRIRGAMVDLMRERGDHSRRDYEKAKASGADLPNRRISIDKRLGEDITLGDILPDQAPAPDAVIEAWSEVWALKWHLLNDQQLRWVKAHAGGLDQKGFAEREGVTQGRVSQIAGDTVRILRGLQPRTSPILRRKARIVVPCSGKWRFVLWRPRPSWGMPLLGRVVG